ncbi:rhomboid family intramembrane serine protease [Alkalinema sp. FACHB-956]|uniref:rhomboid family intramembrane serine protease n=1 Tax=Alkalinema sp. FACHB-956 TaxID=2692768 RepID=UPI001685EBEA|nr:rhomboid family intramembrane serine protease [Alkalinema sp. FACHB-956]MBD2327827.1 rhomboid family intramembrane serine protease [Alkalinema sp. FACHB-956]
MSLDVLIIQLVALSCLVIIARAGRRQSWAWIALAILAVLAIGLLLQAPWTAAVSGTLWVLAIVIPGQGLRYFNRLRLQEQYQQARNWARVLRWLHPLDGWWQFPAIMQAQALAQAGDRDAALALLKRYQTDLTPTGRWVTTIVYQLEGRWAEAVIWAPRCLSEAQMLRETAVLGLYLRALGETGDLNQLVRLVDRCAQQRQRLGSSMALDFGRLYAFAFSGQPEPVAYLFTTSLKACSSPIQQFWQATAEWCAGNRAGAQPLFQALQAQSDVGLHQAIAARLAAPYRPPERTLTLAAYELLNRLRQGLDQDGKYNLRQVVAFQQAPVTYTLVGLNVLIYGLPMALALLWDLERDLSRWLDRIQDPSLPLWVFQPVWLIYRSGVMVPELVQQGQWWRLLTATFLHIDLMHLGLNMLGLWFVGAFVEARLTPWKFLAAYLTCGVGSMAIVAWGAILSGEVDISALGASGAIMGVLGMMGIIFFQEWRHHRAPLAARWLRTFGVIIVLQTVFDVLNPRVSLLGHLSGLILGFGAGWILFRRRPVSSASGDSPLL